MPNTASQAMLAISTPVAGLKCRSSSLNVSSRLRIHQKAAKKNPKSTPETVRIALDVSSIRLNCTPAHRAYPAGPDENLKACSAATVLPSDQTKGSLSRKRSRLFEKGRLRRSVRGPQVAQ